MKDHDAVQATQTARNWRVVTATVLLAGFAASCGAGAAGDDGVATATGSRNANSSSSSDDASREEAARKFAECMREHGVDVPDPEPGQGGMVRIGPSNDEAPASGTRLTPPAGFEEADEACRHFLQDMIGDGPAALDPAAQDRALKFAQCMRENGVNMPDPDFSQGGVAFQLGGDGTAPDPKAVEDAHKACEQYFGPPGGGDAPVQKATQS